MSTKEFCQILIVDETKPFPTMFLLRRHAKHHIGQWEFPSGKVEPGELIPDAALRELKEETNITAVHDDLEHIGNVINKDNNNPDVVWHNVFYLLAVKTKEDWDRLGMPLLNEPNIHDRTMWITLDLGYTLKLLSTSYLGYGLLLQKYKM